jgi:hypothetical protein
VSEGKGCQVNIYNYDTEIADVKRRNPVNAGLLYAASELETAQWAKQQADRRYTLALADFRRLYFGEL